VAESDPGKGWSATDFASVEDMTGMKSVSTYNLGDGTKEESANRTQVNLMSVTLST
jgi:hypothetical protein